MRGVLTLRSTNQKNFHCTKMKFSIKDFFCKCDQICSFLRIWLHLLKKFLMENFIFCAVFEVNKKTQALKVRKALTAKMWKEKEDSLWIQIQHSLMFFNFGTEIHHYVYYYITIKNPWLCILLYYYKCKGSGIPRLENRVKKPSCGLWRHKTELS